MSSRTWLFGIVVKNGNFMNKPDNDPETVYIVELYLLGSKFTKRLYYKFSKLEPLLDFYGISDLRSLNGKTFRLPPETIDEKQVLDELLLFINEVEDRDHLETIWKIVSRALKKKIKEDKHTTEPGWITWESYTANTLKMSRGKRKDLGPDAYDYFLENLVRGVDMICELYEREGQFKGGKPNSAYNIEDVIDLLEFKVDTGSI